MSSLGWQLAVAEALVGNGVTVATFVPDHRLQGILDALNETEMLMRPLAREEECVAYAAGQRLAGGRPVVLMQTSGLGNCLNSLSSLAIPYTLGVPMVVSVRGALGEKNPAQVLMGRTATELMALLGVQSFSVRDASNAAAVVNGICDLAYAAGQCAAAMLEPELGGSRASS